MSGLDKDSTRRSPRHFFRWAYVRWVVAAVLGAAIWLGVGHLASLSEGYAQRQRAEHPAAEPACTQVTQVEVKNPDGSVRSTRSLESKVMCEPPAPEPPFTLPAWLKYTLIAAGVVLLIVLVASGAVFEALALLLTFIFS